MIDEYKAWTVGKAGLRYMKNNKLISAKEVPEALLAVIKPGKIYTEADIPPGIPYKECLFCGKTAKLSRLVNGQTVYLCDEDYYDKSIGKVAARVKELNDG